MKLQIDKLTISIFFALILGIVIGVVFQSESVFISRYVKPFGIVFINLLKFVMVPIVLFSIIDGICSIKDIGEVGSIGLKMALYFVVTTVIAVCMGLFFGTICQDFFDVIANDNLSYSVKKMNFMDVFVNFFPSNWLQPLVRGDMLPTIVIAVLFGLGILMVGGEKGNSVAKGVNYLYEIFGRIMGIVINMMPVAIFCLIADIVASKGFLILGVLGKVVVVVYIAYAVHFVIVYLGSIKLFTKIEIYAFLQKMVPAMVTAFVTTSSNATLPITIDCANRLGSEKKISSFVIPLGCTINMDGAAIYMGVISVFIAYCYGINLSWADKLMVIITATIASIGSVGIPGAAIVMMAMVLTSAGLPVEGVAIVVGIDKLFDMGRTCLNVTGDAVCALVVSSWNEK